MMGVLFMRLRDRPFFRRLLLLRHRCRRRPHGSRLLLRQLEEARRSAMVVVAMVPNKNPLRMVKMNEHSNACPTSEVFSAETMTTATIGAEVSLNHQLVLTRSLHIHHRRCRQLLRCFLRHP